MELVLIAIVILQNTLIANASPTKEIFISWMNKYNKEYQGDPVLFDNKYNVYKNNYNIVETINHNNLTWTASLDSPYADLTPEEFKKYILLPSIPTSGLSVHNNNNTSYHNGKYKRSKSATSDAILDSFDWRSEGSVVTPVHDQGSVGTCWAFSTIGNIEGTWALAKDELIDLSEQFLVDCDGTADYDQNHADCGVFGGWPYLAYQFVMDAGGVPTESSDPYCCGTGDCFPCMQGPIQLCGPPPYYCEPERTAACPNLERHAYIDDWTTISTDEGEIQQSLLDIGPLSALLDATQLQFYESGVWTGKSSDDLNDLLGCHSSNLDHAVLLVGYGVSSADEGSLPYWTVKNSWGEQWGEEGYFRILRGEGTCGINTAVTSSLVQRQ